MESKTKTVLTQEQIAALVAKHFGWTGPIDTQELTEGMMNAIYRLQFDGRDMVLKVGVNDAEPVLLTYEHGLTRTEAHSFRVYAKAGLPVPEIYAEDFSREIRLLTAGTERLTIGESAVAVESACPARRCRSRASIVSIVTSF